MTRTVDQASEAGVGSIQVSRLDGRVVAVDRQVLAALAARLDGRILYPSSAGFDEAVRLWNGMIDKRPAFVIQPVSPRDVRETVAFAHTHGILLSVKGGGHHPAGTAIASGGLTIDMSRMRRVHVDAEHRIAQVQAGCRLGDVDNATQPHGLATVLGSDADTGVGGLTLGGGFGYLTRRFGWTVDNLQEVEIVAADGVLRRASAEEHEDLFWAVRGGGGNFGVVTRFTFRLHEVGPVITGGAMMWPASAAEKVLAAYREVTEAAPRELSVALTMRIAPTADPIPEALRGQPIIAILACHTGDEALVARDLAGFRAVAAPLDTVRRKTYVEHQFVLGFPQPAGLQQYWKSEFLPHLTDGFLEVYEQHASLIKSPRSQLVLFQLGGAIADRDPGDTAMGNRDAQYICMAAGTWSADDPADAEHLEWVRASWKAMAPHSVGSNYVNAQSADEDETRTREAYRDTYSRLEQVKAAWDPGNFWRVNRNISPSGHGGGA